MSVSEICMLCLFMLLHSNYSLRILLIESFLPYTSGKKKKNEKKQLLERPSKKKKRNYHIVFNYLFEQVDDMTADFIISQLLFLDAEDSKKDIKLFINSPGGSVTAGMLKKLHTLIQYCLSFASPYILILEFFAFQSQ